MKIESAMGSPKEGQRVMGKQKVFVPKMVQEAMSFAHHLPQDLLDSFGATPRFYIGTKFEELSSGVVKIQYFKDGAPVDTDYWYRGYLIWPDEDTPEQWRVDDRLGVFEKLEDVTQIIDEVLGE